jgi:hypothetical protein
VPLFGTSRTALQPLTEFCFQLGPSSNTTGSFFAFADSGCTQHVVNNLNILIIPKPATMSLKQADGQPIVATHVGRLLLMIRRNNEYIPVEFDNVYFCPKLHDNLISLHRICTNKRTVELARMVFISTTRNGNSFVWVFNTVTCGDLTLVILRRQNGTNIYLQQNPHEQ